MSASQALKFVPVVAAFAFSGCSSDDSSSSDCTWTSTDSTKSITVEFSSGAVSKIKSLKCGASATAVTDQTKLSALLADNTVYKTSIDTCDKFKALFADATKLAENDPCNKPYSILVAASAGAPDSISDIKQKFATIAATEFTLTSKCKIGTAAARDNIPLFNAKFLADPEVFVTTPSAKTLQGMQSDLGKVAAGTNLCNKYPSEVCTEVVWDSTPTTPVKFTVGWLGDKTAANFRVIDVSSGSMCTGSGATSNADAVTLANRLLTGATPDLITTRPTSCTTTTANDNANDWVTAVKGFVAGANQKSIFDVCSTTYCSEEVSLTNSAYKVGTLTANNDIETKVKFYIKGGSAYPYKVTSCKKYVTNAIKNKTPVNAATLMTTGGDLGTSNGSASACSSTLGQAIVKATSPAFANFCTDTDLAA